MKTRRKGLAFTTFAVLASSLLLMMVALPVVQQNSVETSSAERIGQASFFLESVFSDMDRSLNIGTRRALTTVTNRTVSEGVYAENPRQNISEALRNGTLGGEDAQGMENASLDDWSGRVADVADRSGYSLNTSIINYTFEASTFEVESSFRVNAILKDPVTLATFNKTRNASTDVSVNDLEDPLLLVESKGRYLNKYQKCGFDEPVEGPNTGTQNSSGSFRGTAVIEPSDIAAVNDTSEKIIVSDDLEANYDSSNTDDFGGAVSASSVSTPSNYNDNYVFNTGSIADIEDEDSRVENATLVLNSDEVWITRFEEMFTDGCYIESSEGPDFIERLGGKLENDDGSGLLTMIDVSQLPSELQKSKSAVGYVYFSDSSYGGSESIKGVSDDFSWFMLDQDHIDRWGMDSLVE